MKIKYTLATTLLLGIAFITAQSFYNHTTAKRAASAPSYFLAYPNHAAICVPLFNEVDSTADIQALKGWGSYQWKISNATDSAQFYFNQGISMYYAFHSIEAIASFTKATHLAPGCAMAWYGKALAMGPTINYPNGYRPPEGALAAAIKSNELLANCTPLINAIQYRYSADTTISIKQLRINYASAMQKVYAKYSNNADAVTLCADAQLLLHPWDLYTHNFTPKPWTPQIRSLLEQAIALNPKHPGANHYYIHTMEASATPELALKSAHLMDTLMPQVSHLTHMPSHIYIRTGDYQRGIKVNIAAVAGYNSYLKQYPSSQIGIALYELHNNHLKINCAQMAGNYQIAIASARELQSQLPAYYLAQKGADGNFIQYAYMQPTLTNVRFGKWDDILKTDIPDTLVYASLLQHFARGLAFCHKNNITLAQRELDRINEKINDKDLKINPDNFSSAYEAARIARLILQGELAVAKMQYTASLNYLYKAVAAEDLLIYNKPRDWPIPARQYLANALLNHDKYVEAITVLNKDLTINPNNGWSLTGLRLAYQHAGNQSKLAKVQQQLVQAWKIKDMPIDRPVF
jgi:tetratricopeptide (TPR) repeat protein